MMEISKVGEGWLEGFVGFWGGARTVDWMLDSVRGWGVTTLALSYEPTGETQFWKTVGTIYSVGKGQRSGACADDTFGSPEDGSC
jgi:hypothetical protein